MDRRSRIRGRVESFDNVVKVFVIRAPLSIFWGVKGVRECE